MAELIVDDEDLVVQLTRSEKIWVLHRDIRLRLSSIVSVAPDPKPQGRFSRLVISVPEGRDLEAEAARIAAAAGIVPTAPDSQPD